MRFLLLFLISFSTFAGYMNKADFEDCEKLGRQIHTLKKTCTGDCYKVPNNYQCESFTIADEYVDDLDNKKYGPESNNVSCIDEETCQEELSRLECLSGYHRLISASNSYVYCAEFRGYHQKLSGNKIFKEDPIKKASYDALKLAEKQKEDEDKAAKKAAKDYFKSIDCSTLLTDFEINACNYIKR